MTTPNLYVLARVPDSTEPTIEWTDIPEIKTHTRKTFVFINHSPRRQTSRWVSVDQKRPFEVVCYRRMHWGVMSSHKTFAAAWKAAQKFAKETVL